MKKYSFTAFCDYDRLDKFFKDSEIEISRSFAQKLILEGNVLINGKTANKKDKLCYGDEISLFMPDAVLGEALPEDIPLDILYEDDDLLVVNKPQGMVVHPAPGNYTGTLVNALLFHCKNNLSAINGVLRPGIVHRIDKDTSGLLVVAKNDAAHKSLAEQIKEHSTKREYRLLVKGNIKHDFGTITAPIGRDKNDRKKMCVTPVNSKDATTHYEVLERFREYTYLKCVLETGRTHQIRVHMNYIGTYIIGDKVYGAKTDPFGLLGQMLHAKTLGFDHPRTEKRLIFDSPLPDYFEEILLKLRKDTK